MAQLARQPKLYSEADYNELLKLLALCINAAGGQVRIGAGVLQDTEPPKGFQKEWDNINKELVLRIITHSTSVYIAEEASEWTPPQSQGASHRNVSEPLLIPLASLPSPLSTLDSPPQRPQKPQKRSSLDHIVIDDQRAEQLESDQIKRAALQRIAEWQDPELDRATQVAEDRRRSRGTPSIVSSTPSPRESPLPPSFFKT